MNLCVCLKFYFPRSKRELLNVEILLKMETGLSISPK